MIRHHSLCHRIVNTIYYIGSKKSYMSPCFKQFLVHYPDLCRKNMKRVRINNTVSLNSISSIIGIFEEIAVSGVSKKNYSYTVLKIISI